MNKQHMIIGVAAVVLMGAAAAIASYVTRESLQSQVAEDTVQTKSVAKAQHKKQQQAAAAQPAQPQCDDSNIVGTVAGGAAGGLVGSQVGKGSGKTAATIGGVVGGALLGNQYIPTRNVTCRN